MLTAIQLLKQRRDKLAQEVEMRNWYSGDPSPATTRRMEVELEDLEAMIAKATKRTGKRRKT